MNTLDALSLDNRLLPRLLMAAVLLLLEAACGPVAWGQQADSASALGRLQSQFKSDMPPYTSSAERVEVASRLSQNGVEPGSSFEAAVVLHVAEGWHINAHRPRQDFLIGTSLDLEPHPGLLVADLRYPEPHLVAFSFAGDQLAVYEGDVPIFLSVRASEQVAPGAYTLTGAVRVQACNDQVCLRPSTVPVAIPVRVTGAGGPSKSINQGLFSAYDPVEGFSATASVAGNEMVSRFAERGFVLAFLGLFMIGLALNLTPCVYPMVSVTVSLFGGREETQTGRAFGRALVYVLGIVTMYSALGVAAAITGSLFGTWLQSPWVLAAIGVLLVAMALGMFGAFAVQLPAALRTRLGAAHRVTGPLGLYLSGLVVGVFAAPCIGPPIIALLAFVGARGDPLFGFFAFFVLALGLGLPYLMLGTFSSLLSRLPKSGLWMVWVKKVFGVVLVGAGFFYLGLAFFPDHAAYVVPVALVLGGLYLGFLERSGREQTVFRFVQGALGVVVVLTGVLAFRGLQQPGIAWEAYTPGKLQAAQAANRPVLLDFYADWCIPCLELDHRTFTDDAVIEATKHFVRLKVDLTQFDTPEAARLRRRFEVAGVPTLVFLNAHGAEVRQARVVGFAGPGAFLEHVAQVAD